ncbi:hypothetical protein RHGRI_013837 [Rhododendron griersonianum]|uniref:Serine carboxypeptidase-like 18 n=1 Tax=Rhododendron griersonianum TaxID=479676 RepID=A0AAV6K715_9ERIC|nr:hypothetical protein RHGRI_013837 [Rhododendron griersonianum]
MGQAEAATNSFSFSRSWIKWVHIHLLLLVVISAQSALGGQIVKYLPGYDGELPFKLETGYISVDDSELFYYFIESEGNPQEDPLFLWLTGGPGCTALSGLLYEVGPMEYDISNYTGGLPKLKYYPHARTKTASMIFLDAPVGTGFSYSRTLEGWPSSDTKSSEQSYNFLRKWLVEHPQFLSVHLFIGGDSQAGMIVPLITKKIIDGNKDKAEPYMNIKGYLVGCPMTDMFIDFNSYVQYAHAMALISDEIYENAKRSCKENYMDVDPANSACLVALGDIQKCTKDLNKKHILKPNCDVSSSDPNRRSLEDGASEFLLQPSTVPNPWCTTFGLTHNNIWANDDSVQEALHVRKGTVRQWERCNNSLSYSPNVFSVVSVHKELSRSALEVLVESGDHDMSVPYVGTLKWIKSLNLSLVDDWRPWYVDHQVAGYTIKYSEDGYGLTFATVKGAGHPAPEYYRRECYHLFDKWVNHHPI